MAIATGNKTIRKIALGPNIINNITSGLTSSFNMSFGPLATGGQITYSGDYVIHTFTSSGYFDAATPGVMEILVIAGGGSGGNYGGGGGGAGGVVYRPIFFATTGSTFASIGNGGAAISGSQFIANSGSNSSFGPIVAIGGGRGGVNVQNAIHPSGSPCSTGGSGGGAASPGSTTGQIPGCDGTSFQGNNGGGTLKSTIQESLQPGGGGGGAGVTGSNYIQTAQGVFGGPGGNGIINPISGSTTGQLISGSYWVAGGGAGGSGFIFNPVNATTASGGFGGGGFGQKYESTDAAGNGLPNTGGGGGGFGYSGNNGTNGTSGAGGSGVVVIRYRYK